MRVLPWFKIIICVFRRGFLNVLKAYGLKKCLEKNKLNFPHLFLEGVAFDDKTKKYLCQING